MDKSTSAVSGTGARLDRRDYAIILTAVVCALVLRLVFFRGVQWVDDFNYLRHAADVWKGRFSYGDLLYLHGTRPLVFLPVSWLYSVFGPSEAAVIAWPLAASLATIVFVYLIGREMFDRECGAWAACLAVFLPLMVEESTRILPGAIMNLIIAVVIYTFILSERSRHRWLWLLVSGGVYGAMLLTGELGMLIGCFFPLAAVVLGRFRFRSYWPVAAGFAAIVGANAMYQWIETGDPLFKSHLSRTILAAEVPSVQLFYYLKLILKPFAAHGGVFYLAAAGAFGAIRSRNRPALFLVLFLAVMWLLMDFMSTSLTTYHPLYRALRHASILSVPAVLLSGYGVAWVRRSIDGLAGRRGVRAAGSIAAVLLVAVVLLGSLVTLTKAGRSSAELRAQLKRLRDYVVAARGETVYVPHWVWNIRVAYFMDFDDRYLPSGYDPYHAVRLSSADSQSLNRYVQTLKRGEAMRGGILIDDETLLNASRGEGDVGLVGRGEIPPVLARPPSQWRLIDRFTVAGSTIAVYQIPDGYPWPGSG
jgi:hypothetical protein